MEEHDGHRVVQHALAEDEGVEQPVAVYLRVAHDGQRGDGVHGGYQRPEHERLDGACRVDGHETQHARVVDEVADNEGGYDRPPDRI